MAVGWVAWILPEPLFEIDEIEINTDSGLAFISSNISFIQVIYIVSFSFTLSKQFLPFLKYQALDICSPARPKLLIWQWWLVGLSLISIMSMIQPSTYQNRWTCGVCIIVKYLIIFFLTWTATIGVYTAHNYSLSNLTIGLSGAFLFVVVSNTYFYKYHKS